MPSAPAPHQPEALPKIRCVAHPGRPAVDRCPVCERPRCGADAAGRGCAVCRAGESSASASVDSVLEVVVRAALGASAVAFPAGWVLAEYVSSPVYLKYLAPLIVGMACSAAAAAAAGSPRQAVLRSRVRLVAVVYAVLSTALGFVLEGTYGVFAASTDVLLPYVVAAGAAWLWAAPPRSRRPRVS